MDFGSFGVNGSIVIAIVAVSEALKKIDKEDKLKRFYVFLPTVLSALFAVLVTNPIQWQQLLLNMFQFFGFSTFLYEMIKKVVLQKFNSVDNQQQVGK